MVEVLIYSVGVDRLVRRMIKNVGEDVRPSAEGPFWCVGCITRRRECVVVSGADRTAYFLRREYSYKFRAVVSFFRVAWRNYRRLRKYIFLVFMTFWSWKWRNYFLCQVDYSILTSVLWKLVLNWISAFSSYFFFLIKNCLFKEHKNFNKK